MNNRPDNNVERLILIAMPSIIGRSEKSNNAMPITSASNILFLRLTDSSEKKPIVCEKVPLKVSISVKGWMSLSWEVIFLNLS